MTDWHVSKNVSLGLIAFIMGQVILLIAWGVKLDSRMSALEIYQGVQDGRIHEVEKLNDRVLLLEERQRVIMKQLLPPNL